MSQLSDFLEGAGEQPYRELIQYHLRRQSTPQLQAAAVGEAAMLPERLQPFVMAYIDGVNDVYAHDQHFWRTATCREAFESFIQIAIQHFPLNGLIHSVQDALRPENHGLAFQLFQIPTVTLAYSASSQRTQREFMGVHKGLFG